MHGIGKIFDTKLGGLIFSLICGAAYYIIILSFIMKYSPNGGMLLGFFFLPAIVCGAALVIFKTAEHLRSEENFGKINLLIYLHIVLTAVSIVFLLDIIR